MRTLAPSGSPIRPGELLKCLAGVGAQPATQLREELCAALGVRHAFLLANGRGAMSLLLQCIAAEAATTTRKAVVVPSYTCYSVAASAIKAGLEVIVCDIDEKTLCYDMQQLESVDFDRVIAIVSANLYGIPDNLEQLEELARRVGVFLVDDAAQCLGATVAGRNVGTFGDAGILSFDKGKVITSINGGVIVTNHDALAGRIGAAVDELPAQSLSARLLEIIKLQVYFLMLNPWLYGIPANLPFLKLGETRYEEDYPLQLYFGGLAPLALEQFRRIRDINAARTLKAGYYDQNLPRIPMLQSIEPLPGTQPIWLRYPLRIRDADARAEFLQQYRRLGCSQSYPLAIAEVPELRGRISVHNGRCDAGRTIASQLVTLPTHAFVRLEDIEVISTGLAGLAAPAMSNVSDR